MRHQNLKFRITQVIHEACKGLTLFPAERVSKSQKSLKIEMEEKMGENFWEKKWEKI